MKYVVYTYVYTGYLYALQVEEKLTIFTLLYYCIYSTAQAQRRTRARVSICSC